MFMITYELRVLQPQETVFLNMTLRNEETHVDRGFCFVEYWKILSGYFRCHMGKF
jgi:hypothetical protein